MVELYPIDLTSVSKINDEFVIKITQLEKNECEEIIMQNNSCNWKKIPQKFI